MAAKDPLVAETGGSEDALDLLSLSQRLLLDPERAVSAAAAGGLCLAVGQAVPAAPLQLAEGAGELAA